jgi:hypothetical protein
MDKGNNFARNQVCTKGFSVKIAKRVQRVCGEDGDVRIRLGGVWSSSCRIMHTQGVKAMHRCAGGHDAGWSMVAVA